MTKYINPFGEEPEQPKPAPFVGNGRIVHDLPAETYFKAPGLSASALVHGVKSMKHMRYYMTNPSDTSPAMRWGKLCHSALLEPDRFERDIAVFEGPKRGNEWKEFQSANEGREVVTLEESAQLAEMIEAVHGRADAKALLTDGHREVSMFWSTDEYGEAKGRMDVYDVNHIVDLKTTGDIARFQNTAAQLLINVRVGWYQVGIHEITGKLLPVYIVAVEQNAPFDVRVYEYDSEALALGRDISTATAKRYRECHKTGVYPGVCSDVQTLRLPEWATIQQMNRVGARELEEMEADQL